MVFNRKGRKMLIDPDDFEEHTFVLELKDDKRIVIPASTRINHRKEFKKIEALLSPKFTLQTDNINNTYVERISDDVVRISQMVSSKEKVGFSIKLSNVKRNEIEEYFIFSFAENILRFSPYRRLLMDMIKEGTLCRISYINKIFTRPVEIPVVDDDVDYVVQVNGQFVPRSEILFSNGCIVITNPKKYLEK